MQRRGTALLRVTSASRRVMERQIRNDEVAWSAMRWRQVLGVRPIAGRRLRS